METAIQTINGAAGLVIPEIILLATVCLAFTIGPFLVNDRGHAAQGLRHRWGALSLIGLLSAAAVWWTSAPTASASGPFQIDDLVWFTRLLSFSIGAILVLVLWSQADDSVAAECQACLLAILAGVNLTAAANDLTGLFLGLELVSIPTYVLLYLPRRDASNREATLKYFLLSVFSSALVLMGFSYLYGVCGTTNLAGLESGLSAAVSNATAPLLLLAFALVLAGISFRITAVPFHFYAPDVFQGVVPAAAALLSFVPKVVGFVALFRIAESMSLLSPRAGKLIVLASIEQTLVAGLAVLTMFVGNLLALRQRNIARMMAYSSIAHAGYMLVGFAVISPGAMASGWGAVLFYLAIYGLATIGVFGVIVTISDPRKPAQSIDDFSGLSRVHPIAAVMMAVLLFGLTGLPPTAGFLGKLNLFLAAWSQGSELGRWLAMALALNAAIAAWYYLRLIAVMYLQPSSQTGTSKLQIPALVGTTLCAAATLVLFVAPQWLWSIAESAGRLVG